MKTPTCYECLNGEHEGELAAYHVLGTLDGDNYTHDVCEDHATMLEDDWPDTLEFEEINHEIHPMDMAFHGGNVEVM